MPPGTNPHFLPEFSVQTHAPALHVPLLPPQLLPLATGLATHWPLLASHALTWHGHVLGGHDTAVCVQLPALALQESVLHLSPSSQLFSEPDLQLPPLHESFTVHPLPSLHDAVLWPCPQPDAELQ